MITQTIIWLKSGTGARQNSVCVTRRLGLISGWRKEVFWEWEPALLVCLHLPIHPYNKPPEAQRGAVTCPRSHSTLRCQASALLRITFPVLVLSREKSLLCCFLAV